MLIAKSRGELWIREDGDYIHVRPCDGHLWMPDSMKVSITGATVDSITLEKVNLPSKGKGKR